MMILYTDAQTFNNGRPGQKTNIVVVDENLNVLVSKSLGDKTINYGEISAIIEALKIANKNKDIKTIYSDSMVAVGWANRGRVRNKRLLELNDLAKQANLLLRTSDCMLRWKKRDFNKAGWFFEKVPFEKDVQRYLL